MKIKPIIYLATLALKGLHNLVTSPQYVTLNSFQGLYRYKDRSTIEDNTKRLLDSEINSG